MIMHLTQEFPGDRRAPTGACFVSNAASGVGYLLKKSSGTRWTLRVTLASPHPVIATDY